CAPYTPSISSLFNVPSTTGIHTLSLHDALPILEEGIVAGGGVALVRAISALEKLPTGNLDETTGVQIVAKAIESPLRTIVENARSEEHTSELQSRENLVCRLLLEKKNDQYFAAK